MTMTGGALFGVPVPSGPVEPNTQFLKVVPNLAGGFEVVSGVLNEQTITNEAGVTSIEMTAVRARSFARSSRIAERTFSRCASFSMSMKSTMMIPPQFLTRS